MEIIRDSYVITSRPMASYVWMVARYARKGG